MKSRSIVIENLHIKRSFFLSRVPFRLFSVAGNSDSVALRNFTRCYLSLVAASCNTQREIFS